MRSFSRSAQTFCCATLLMSGCGMPISTMHGPVPTRANTSSVTVGAAPVFLDDTENPDPLSDLLIIGSFASVREGVSERLEIGGSIGFLSGITAEAKYNVVQGPFFVSANLAVSAGVASVGVHPALLVGTERIYGGGKLMTFPSNLQSPWTVLFAGGSFGGRIRIVPEITWMRDPADGETNWVAGIGVQVQRRTSVLR